MTAVCGRGEGGRRVSNASVSFCLTMIGHMHPRFEYGPTKILTAYAGKWLPTAYTVPYLKRSLINKRFNFGDFFYTQIEQNKQWLTSRLNFYNVGKNAYCGYIADAMGTRGNVPTNTLSNLRNTRYEVPQVKLYLNMELDRQSLFGLHVYGCTHWLRPLKQTPTCRIWAHIRGRYWSAKIDDISLRSPPMYRYQRSVG